MFSPSRQPATKATKKMLNMTNVCVLPSQVLVMPPKLTTGLKRRRNINCDGTSAIISTKASLKLNKSNVSDFVVVLEDVFCIFLYLKTFSEFYRHLYLSVFRLGVLGFMTTERNNDVCCHLSSFYHLSSSVDILKN